MLLVGLNLSAQNVVVKSNLKVDSTAIKITKSDSDYYVYSSFDNKKTDSLIVTIGTIGTNVTALKIDLTEKPKAYLSLWSDYPEYNGKNTLDLEFEFYTLELNKTKFEKGDLIMGRIKGKSKVITYNSHSYQIEFEGEFNHQIGSLIIKKTAEQKYRIISNH